MIIGGTQITNKRKTHLFLYDNLLFRAVFSYSEQIYCENITKFYFYKLFKKKIKKIEKCSKLQI